MSEGNWRVVLAAIGWLILAGTAPPHKGNSSAEAERQERQATGPTDDYSPYPDKFAERCYQAKDHDTADLCAQWRAAIAAERAVASSRQSNLISALGGLLSFISIALVVYALRQTERSLKEARTANEIAEVNARRGLRPYMWPEAAWFTIADDGEPVAQVVIKNFGQTPAINKRGWVHTWVECYPLHDPLPEPPGDLEMGSAIIGPGATSEMTQPHGVAISPFSRGEIEAGRAALYLYGYGTYISVFGKTHFYRFIYFATGDGALERGRFMPYTSGNVIDTN